MPTPGQAQRAAQKFIVFEQFEKLNTQSVRQALKESELAWIENLQPIAPNNLKTIPGPGTSLATLAETVKSAFYAVINGIDYIFIFSTLGAGFFVNISAATIGQFAPDSTFSNADLTTWQGSRVLINDPTVGYSTFDGTLFVQQGNVSPNIIVTNGGSNYPTPPPVTISGGSGSGATAVAVLSGGSVVGVTLTNAGTGYHAGDTLTVAFGTGAGSGAAGHVTMTGFSIVSLNLVNGGQFNSDGLSPHNLVFTGGGGSGAAGTAAITFSGVVGVFFVSGVTLTNGGSGYSSAPTITVAGINSIIVNPVITANLSTESVATIVLDAGGSGYVAPPTVSIVGGGGSGATAHSTISGGAVNALILDTAGSGYTSTPTVVIGTGSGAAATAIVWPFVSKGNTLAVFAGRVWLNFVNATTGLFNGLQYTGTKGFDDFVAANASGSLTISDADLQHSITALRNYNNYLFIAGDQSIKQIGNISVSGSTTLFTILTLSSDQGTIYPLSCGSFNRVFMFANQNGIYGVFGSSVQKISDDLDGIFSLIDFSQGPVAAIADVNNVHNIAWLVRYKDPLSSTRSLLLIFNGKKWWLASNTTTMKTIVSTSSVSTGKTTLYSSSGTDVTPLFNNALTTVTFKLQSALTHHGNAVQRKKILSGGVAVTLASGTGNLSVTFDTENASTSKTYSLVTGFQLPGGASGAEGSGRYLGMTITGTLAGCTITNAAIEYQETALWT